MSFSYAVMLRAASLSAGCRCSAATQRCRAGHRRRRAQRQPPEHRSSSWGAWLLGRAVHERRPGRGGAAASSARRTAGPRWFKRSRRHVGSRSARPGRAVGSLAASQGPRKGDAAAARWRSSRCFDSPDVMCATCSEAAVAAASALSGTCMTPSGVFAAQQTVRPAASA